MAWRIFPEAAVFNFRIGRSRTLRLTRMKCLPRYFLVFFLATGCARALFADGFEVSGTVETVSSRTNRHTFYIQSDGLNVFIQCSAGTLDQSGGTEFGSDGTNGFLLQKSLYKNVRGKTNPVVNDATMHIESSPLPHRQA